MHCEGIVSKLAEQLLEVSSRTIHARARPADAPVTHAVARSLRTTLAAIVQRRNPRDLGAKSFLCVVDPEGRPAVTHGGRVLPISGSYLRHLFEALGVGLAAGQAILLDAVLVRHLVEDALARLGREEAEARERKSRLVAAHLAADALEQGLAFQAGALPSEAA